MEHSHNIISIHGSIYDEVSARTISPPTENPRDLGYLGHWAAVPIMLALTPLIVFAYTVAAIYRKIVYGEAIAVFISKYLVLTSLLLDKNELSQKREALLNANHNVQQVNTPSGLNGILIRQEGATKWILYFQGVKGSYETNFKELLDMSNSTGANVACFNYRGVGLSTGIIQGSNDMYQDGRTALDCLDSLNIPLANILIAGGSMGGAVAIDVARQHPGVPVLVDRSFGSLDDAIRGMPVPILNRVAARVVGVFWQMDSASKFLQITARRFVVISRQEQVITFQKSLYSQICNTNATYRLLHLSFLMRSNCTARERTYSYGFMHYHEIPVSDLRELLRPFLENE